MGIDACIYPKTTDAAAPADLEWFGDDGKLLPVTSDSYPPAQGATHCIDQAWRYYGPGYERGPWLSIAAVLMALFACKNVETVWYFGDCHDEPDPITRDTVLEICRHYMTVGTRRIATAPPGTPADSPSAADGAHHDQT